MRSSWPRRRPASLAIMSTTVALACAGSAAAFTIDARRLGMGGALVPGADLASANVAYQVVPRRPDGRGRVVPLPLGLVQLATDFPTLDAQSESFDVLRLTELVLNPPFFLELASPDPLDGDIAIAIARDAMSIDFEDAQAFLPKEPVRTGSIYSRPLVRLDIRGASAALAPVLEAEGRIGFDDPLYDVLAHGQPLLPDSRYEFSSSGATMAGSAIQVGWTGGGWGRTDGDGLYLGAYGKYILGVGFGASAAQFGLATADTIFGDADPLDVTFDGWTRYAPFGNLGNGLGLDAGVAYRRGPWDFGLGVRDLGSRVYWGATVVEHSYLDEATGEMVNETVAEDEPYTHHLPTQTTLNVGWSGSRTQVGADLTTSRWGTTTHLGAERRLGLVALRAGLLTDARRKLQYACGFGVGMARLWFDVGLQSHAYAMTDERGWTLGTSFAIH
jgi:hypothetical protein